MGRGGGSGEGGGGRGYGGPPLLNNPPDWRTGQSAPGNNIFHGNRGRPGTGDMYRNQSRGGGRYQNSPNYNNGGGGNSYHNNYSNSHHQPSPHDMNGGGQPYQHGRTSWRDGRHPVEPPAREYDPEVLRLLEEEGLFLRNPTSRKRSLRFPRANFYCRLCDYHCDEPTDCIKHIRQNRHQKLATVREFDQYLLSLPVASPAMMAAVGAAVERTAREQGITDQEKAIREQAVRDLQDRITPLMPEVLLELTGSTYSGLALCSGDVNVSIFVNEKESPYKALMALKKIIEECDDYKDFSNELRSYLPCLSYTSSQHSNCRVVLGVGSASIRAMCRLMAVFASIDRRFVVLARALRYWAQLCNISDQKSGSLPSVAYYVLVAHFLQQTESPILPTLRQVHPPATAETFPLPEDVNSDAFKSTDTQSVGQLWLKMIHYYAYEFKFVAYNVNVTQSAPSARLDKTYSKKMSIEDPFNPKRNLTRTISNTAVLEFIMDRLLKIVCRYFSVPQLSFGQLFFTLMRHNRLITEKRSKNTSFSDETTTAESDNDKSSELDQALERLSLNGKTHSSVDSDDYDLSGVVAESKAITEPSQLTHTFDSITFDEATRIMNLLDYSDFEFQFLESKFTEGETVPVFCSSCQQEGHIRDDCEEEKLPELRAIDPISSSQTHLLTDILDCLRTQMEPSPDEVIMREDVVKNLALYIKKEHRYRKAHLQLFGSSANGFGFANSDLDVCITFNDGQNKEQLDQNFVIHDLARLLKQCRGEFSEVLAIPTAKVPIVKFVSVNPEIEGDLSLYNTLALHNTKLLWTYSMIDPRVKALGYGLKYFAKKCDIGDASRGSLSSYAFTLMLIHFMQQCEPPVVPVLQQLCDEADPPEPVMVEGWNTWYFSDLKQLPIIWPGYGKNTCSTGELWIQLFRYYTEIFDFEEQVITIRKKEPLFRLEKLWNNHSIAIEDPYDLNHNLGGALSRKMNTFIMKAFINGRHLYGGVMKPPPTLEQAAVFLFDQKQLTGGAPPNDRGCRRCGYIGHLVKNCPQRADSGNRRRDDVEGGGKQQRLSEARLQAAGSAPTKRKDDKAMLGDKGMTKITESLPPGTDIIDVAYDEVVGVLKAMLDDRQSRDLVLSKGYRIYTIQWFMTISWKEAITLLAPDVLLENKEPLVIVKVEERPFGTSEEDYVKQFLRHSHYFEEYLIDLNVFNLENDKPTRDIFMKGLNQVTEERKQKLEKKQNAKKEGKKLRREQAKVAASAAIARIVPEREPPPPAAPAVVAAAAAARAPPRAVGPSSPAPATAAPTRKLSNTSSTTSFIEVITTTTTMSSKKRKPRKKNNAASEHGVASSSKELLQGHQAAASSSATTGADAGPVTDASVKSNNKPQKRNRARKPNKKILLPTDMAASNDGAIEGAANAAKVKPTAKNKTKPRDGVVIIPGSSVVAPGAQAAAAGATSSARGARKLPVKDRQVVEISAD